MSNRIKYASCKKMCLALEMASLSLVLPIGQSSLLLRQELAVLLHGQQTLFIFTD